MDITKLTDEILSSTYVIKMLDERIEDGMDENTLELVEENLSKGLSLINSTLDVITKELQENPEKLTVNEDINISNLEITKELNNLTDNKDLPLE
tara:strand:- start:235 stop:519 length:285 start_codon:yes stop_codon:yes gene_type:complete